MLVVATAGCQPSVACTVTDLLDSAGTFFSQLASLNWLSLLLRLALFALYLLLRSRALWGPVQTAYPRIQVRWRDVWGAYMVGYAINNVFPLGGGNIAQLFLTRVAIPESSYPTVAAALWTGVIFDWFIGLLIMGFAFTQGVFPKPPDFSKLPAFDISFFAANMRFTLFVLTVLAILFWSALRCSRRVCGPSGSGSDRGSRSCATVTSIGAGWPPGSSRAGLRGSSPTGRCWTRSTSAARSPTPPWRPPSRGPRRC